MATPRSRKSPAHDAVVAAAPTAISLLARTHGFPVAEVDEEYQERAAVREYVGGAPRLHAEADALCDVVEVLRRRHRRLF